jgi:plasminogen activator
MLDLSVEFFIVQKKKFTLSALAGYKRNNWKWKAYGGTYIYSEEWLWDTIGGWPDDLLGITYEQWWDVPYIGVGLAAEVGPVEFDCRLIGSTIVDAEDEDHHHLRGLIFKEKFEDGEFIGVKAGVTYNITSTLGVGLGLDYQNFEEVKGGMIVEDTITGMVEEYTGDITGADNELVMVSLGVQYNF